jgi:hypothetical protein
LCKKYSAAYGGRIKFFRARILLILLCKINKIRALKKYSLAAYAAKGRAGGFLHNPRIFFIMPILLIVLRKMSKIGIIKILFYRLRRQI